MKKIICGCFGTIYEASILKNGLMSVNGRVDCTDECIDAVLQHFITAPKYKFDDNGWGGIIAKGKDGSEISMIAYDNKKFKLTPITKEEPNNENLS